MINFSEVTRCETQENYLRRDGTITGSDEARAKAESEGLTIRYAQSNELFIDIDSELDYAQFCQNIGILHCNWMPVQHEAYPSKSGGERRHIVVTLPHNITNTERILLQAVLGSDRKRELLSWLRELQGEPTPTLFFEKKPAQPLLGTCVAPALLTEGVTQ